MNRWILTGLVAFCWLALGGPARAEYPKPSPYPVSWELTLTYGNPQRIVVQAPGDANPTAYWYVTFHVVNNTERDTVDFYPNFDLVTDNGNVFHSDNNLKPAVFDAIKARERIKYLQDSLDIGGPLRHGEDESKDGVAIWPEPALHMGTFTIFMSGFWGEAVTVQVNGKDVNLRKTLQLTYRLNSDANHPGEGELTQEDSQYVMR